MRSAETRMTRVKRRWGDEEAPEDYGRLVGMFGQWEVPRLVECGGWRNWRESGSLEMDLLHGTAPDFGPRIWAVGDETAIESRMATGRGGPRKRMHSNSDHSIPSLSLGGGEGGWRWRLTDNLVRLSSCCSCDMCASLPDLLTNSIYLPGR